MFDVCFTMLQVFSIIGTVGFSPFSNFVLFSVQTGNSSSPNKCFDQRDCEVPNLIQCKVQLPTGSQPTRSGKYVFKYLIAIYAASAALSGYLIISGLK